MTNLLETTDAVRPVRSLLNAVPVLIASIASVILAPVAPYIGIPLAAVTLLAAIAMLVLRIVSIPTAMAAVIISATVLLAAAAMLLFLTPAHVEQTDGGTTFVETP